MLNRSTSETNWDWSSFLVAANNNSSFMVYDCISLLGHMPKHFMCHSTVKFESHYNNGLFVLYRINLHLKKRGAVVATPPSCKLVQEVTIPRDSSFYPSPKKPRTSRLLIKSCRYLKKGGAVLTRAHAGKHKARNCRVNVQPRKKRQSTRKNDSKVMRSRPLLCQNGAARGKITEATNI